MNKRNFKVVLLMMLVSLVFSIGPAWAQEGEAFSLTVLHTNDVHARVDQFDSGGNSCDEEEAAANECVGGAARVKTAADAVRAEAANTVLVDAGDQFQGTLFFNQYQGGEAEEMMNLLGYDAMTIGNHEFDSGPGTLGSFLRGINFPAVSANIDASAEPELAGLIQPYTVLDVNGEQVGVVGVTTVETGILSSPGPNVTFNEAAPSVQAAVDELTGQGINKIVVLSHMGYLADQELANAVTGVDVIVGGHSHTLLSNTDPDAAGPYPTVVDATDGSPVLIVSNGAYARNLGRLNVSFDADGVVTEYSGDPIPLDSSVAQDEAVQARVQALAGPVEALTNQVIGTAAVELDGDRTRCRFGECTMGNLITDAMLWATASEGTQIAIQNGGGIRASINAGEVTLGDVLTVLPFGNLISTFELTGEEVVQALENGVSRAENPDNEGTGRFPQVAGLRYSWNPAQPVGSRITSVEVKNADGSYSPIDPAATYKVVSNDFMRGGGDGYEVFTTARNAYDFGEPLDQAVQRYISAMSPVEPVLEGRVSQGEGAEMMTEGEAAMAEEGDAAMAEEGAAMVAGCAEDYTVQADDWLSRVAERFLGDVLAYPAIVDATNAAAAAGGNYTTIADPNIIEVGQVLCIPAQDGATMDEGAAMEGDAAMAEGTEEAAMDGDAAMAEGTEETAMADGTTGEAAMDENAATSEEDAGMMSQTIVDLALADERFSTLVSALQQAELVETLQGAGPFTVFAPTNAAFESLPDGALDELMADVPKLKDVLLYHVVPAQVLAADVVGLSSADTVLGQPLTVSVDGEMVKINEASVVETDLQASNGVIHVIDSVLLPPAE